MIEIIDNFLEEEDYRNLYNIVTDEHFPWCAGPVLYFNELLKQQLDDNGNITFPCEERFNYQFYHSLYHNSVPQSPYFKILDLFFDKLNVATWVSSKINNNPCSSKIIEHGFHYDNENKHCRTAVYYLNTNDGYTKFETGEKVESVSNRIVIFPTKIMHTGTTTTNISNRLTLNINFFPIVK